MKASNVCGLALTVAGVRAFPSLLTSLDRPIAGSAIEGRQVQGTGNPQPPTPPPFNATAQKISTSGQYKFVPPTATDARGECPGLNAMANHGYLPHNGIATIQQFQTATQQVFGMAPDLGGFLAYYGAIVDGNGASWSINGGPHVGIGGSHGNYESDSSPLHGDFNQYGDIPRLVLSQYKTLRDLQPNAATSNYNLEVLRQFRGLRFTESINKNPLYTYSPFAGIEVSQAAYTFIYRFMANKSAEAPEGILSRDVLKSFFAINGTDANPTWTRGYNRIPDNWYKRNPSDEYSIPYFQGDILYFAETQPEILAVGCNMGKVNTYNTISPEILTNGAYTAADVAKNPLCYSSAFAAYGASTYFGLSPSQTTQLQSAITSFGKALGVTCPTVKSFNTTALAACPGNSFYGGPSGPVAPGAIQSNP